MDEIKGDTLLVGEGNFSFSVAFAKRLLGKGSVSITSTSLLDEKSLFSLHESAAENIESIKNAGVEVLLEVNATMLETHKSLHGRKFHRIIFNFPHIGGKSNIKKNRQLLKEFFKSAVELLHEGGDILLSLCRGQGGTPVDKPVRAWHDSWQAVAMAAYVDLILYRYSPFDPEEWADYNCTGFRSRDQNFFMGAALTYFFKKSSPVHVFDESSVETLVSCNINGDVVETNKYIADKINKKLLGRDDHPLQWAIQKLNRSLLSEFGSQNVYYHENVKHGVILNNILWEEMKKTRDVTQDGCNHTNTKPEFIIGEDSNANVMHIENSRKSSICPTFCVGKHGCSDSLKLRTTLLDNRELLETFFQDDKIVRVGYGEVYRRTWISPDDLPVQHEYMMLIPQNSLNRHESEFDSLNSLKNKICEILKPVLKNADIVTSNSEPGCLPVWYESYFSEVCVIEAGYKSANSSHKTACNQVSAKGAASFHQESCKVTKLSKVIGYMGTLNTAALPQKFQDRAKPGDSLVILQLDCLVQVMYDIPSQILLWSDSPDFQGHFKDVALKGGDTDQVVFQSISYFPPLWRHDLSFWEKSDETFNEQRFIDIVRNIAGDALTEVILMNVWRDPESSRISKCYRQVYQSLDSAICHTKAHDFQNAVRLRVSEIMGVELR